MLDFGYLFDENMDVAIASALRERHSELRAFCVGEVDAPSRGTLDPEILKWCDSNACALITNNRKSMPQHLKDHLAAGGHIPAIFVLRPGHAILPVADWLWDLATLSLPGEFADQIRYFSRFDFSAS